MSGEGRRLEEQEQFPNGIRTEWGPSRAPAGSEYWTDPEWRAYVRKANASAKASGSFTRYRSVDASAPSASEVD